MKIFHWNFNIKLSKINGMNGKVERLSRSEKRYVLNALLTRWEGKRCWHPGAWSWRGSFEHNQFVQGQISVTWQSRTQAHPSHNPRLLFSRSVTSDSVTAWTTACQASLSLTISKFAQIHVHWVGDAIQPSHLLLPTSPVFNLSQHQGFFHWVGSLHQVAKVVELQLQRQSFQLIFRTDFLKDLLVWSLSPRDS